jgi:hypothetical protein
VAVAALARQLIELCVLRRGPQDLPYSPAATRGAIVALLALQAAVGVTTGAPAGAIAARLAVTLLLLVGVTTWLLRGRGFGNRAMQTVLAQGGSGVLFSLAMLPAALALMPYVDGSTAGAAPPPQAMVPALAALVLFVWKLRVDASIWRHALELAPPRALLLAVVLVVAELFLLLLFAPPAPAAAGS